MTSLSISLRFYSSLLDLGERIVKERWQFESDVARASLMGVGWRTFRLWVVVTDVILHIMHLFQSTAEYIRLILKAIKD